MILSGGSSSRASSPPAMRGSEGLGPKDVDLSSSPPTVSPFTDGFSPDGLLFGRYMPRAVRPSTLTAAALEAANARVYVRRSLALAEEAVSISTTIITGDGRKSKEAIKSK